MSKLKVKKKSRRFGDISRVSQIYNFMVHQNLSELNWEEKEFKIIIRREFGSGMSFRRYGREDTSRISKKETTAPVEEIEKNAISISSPIVGVFYSSPAPGAPPFVQEGDIVSAGQTVCIVEAMKLMNEIQAEMKCKILKVLGSNGHSVKVNEPLFLVLPVSD